MTSIAIKGARYLVKPDEVLKYAPFGKTFLAEGDSWMDASAWNQGSLPDFLARAFNKDGKSNLIVNIATSGHTLTKIVNLMQGDLLWWLKQQEYAGLLFSAGGNDFIDAARDVAPGAGILKDCRGPSKPSTARQCISEEAVEKLVAYLSFNFNTIYQAVRGGLNAATPIYLNCYDTPVARDAPAIRGISGPWLYTAYVKNGIPLLLWDDLTELLFAEIKATIQGWATDKEGVVVVATSGLLDRADADSDGDSNDWVNEIHPNKSGWKKQAAAWLELLR